MCVGYISCISNLGSNSAQSILPSSHKKVNHKLRQGELWNLNFTEIFLAYLEK